MYNMYPNTGGLADSNPSCHQLRAQPATFNSQQPAPYQPMNDLPPGLQPYVPAMAVSVGNAMARVTVPDNSGYINPAFVFLTNNVLLGHYNNQLWFQMVSFGMMLLWIKTANAAGVSVESLIQAAAGDAVVMKASFLACSNQAVFSALPPQLQMEVRQHAANHDSLRASFDGMVQNYHQQRALQSNPQAYGQAIGGLAGAAIATQVPAAPTANLYGSPVSKVRNPNDQMVYNTPAVTGTPSQLKQVTPRARAAKLDPFSTFDAPAAAVAPSPPISLGTVTEFVPDQTPTIRAIHQPEEANANEWVPLDGQYYKPAYHAIQWELVYERQVTSSGKQVVIATALIKDDEAMEEAEHQIPTLNRAMRDALAARYNRPAGDAVVTDLELLTHGMRSQRVDESPEQTEKLRNLGLDSESNVDNLDTEYSIEALVSQARMTRLAKGSSADVYLTAGTLGTTIVTASKQVPTLIERLAKAHTLTDAVNTLNDTVDQNKTDPDLLAVIAQVGQYLTNEVNFILQRRMGLDVWVTDILQDTQELFNHLREEKGRAYFDAFTAHQSKLVKALFGPEKVGVYEINAGEANLVVGYRLVFDREIGVALLNMDSSEFGIVIHGTEAFEVFSTNFPGFEQFITSVVDAWPTSDRVVVATIDGKLYGVHRSIMGDKPAIVFNA